MSAPQAVGQDGNLPIAVTPPEEPKEKLRILVRTKMLEIEALNSCMDQLKRELMTVTGEAGILRAENKILRQQNDAWQADFEQRLKQGVKEATAKALSVIKAQNDVTDV